MNRRKFISMCAALPIFSAIPARVASAYVVAVAPSHLTLNAAAGALCHVLGTDQNGDMVSEVLVIGRPSKTKYLCIDTLSITSETDRLVTVADNE